MDLKTISQNIIKHQDQLGKKDFLGKHLEDADPSLLEITDETLGQHVAIQPTAIAFWSTCYKQALRQYERAKRDYEIWRRSKYVEAKNKITGKATISEVEAQIDAMFPEEVQLRIRQIDESEDQADILEGYYKGWSQKSYSMREHAALAMDERYQSDSIMEESVMRKTVTGNLPKVVPKKPNTEEESNARKQRIRAIMSGSSAIEKPQPF